MYVWADGIYVKAGLEKDKAAMLVLIAALRNGRKVVLAVESGYRESTESWATLLRDLTARGLRAPRLLIADGHLGIWGAVRTVFPTVAEQRCWNHRLVNVLDTVPKKLQAEARALLTKMPYAATRAEAERQKRAFQAWASKKGVAGAGRRLDTDWERLVTFYAFPKEHWKHLRTTDESVKWPMAASGDKLGWGTGDPDQSVGHEAAGPTAQAALRRIRRAPLWWHPCLVTSSQCPTWPIQGSAAKTEGHICARISDRRRGETVVSPETMRRVPQGRAFGVLLPGRCGRR